MKRFKQILCVLDSDSPEKTTLERALTLAENNQARLKVVAVTPGMRTFVGLPGVANPAGLLATVVNEQLQKLQSLLEPYRDEIGVETEVLQGTPFLQIIREVLRCGHDLVIKSPEQLDFLDQLFGSNDMHLLRKCPCPVWLIKPSATKAYRCILAAVDVDDSLPADEAAVSRDLNHRILELASSVALADFAELHIVHVWDAPGEGLMRGVLLNKPEAQVDTYIRQIENQRSRGLKTLVKEVSAGQDGKGLDYLKPKTHLLKGWARKEIPLIAKRIDADLLVMGTVARTGVPGFIMGNTAETILNQIDCSVLAIKPSGFATPVSLEE